MTKNYFIKNGSVIKNQNNATQNFRVNSVISKIF